MPSYSQPAPPPVPPSEPLVSIVIACRDVSAYIDAALWSALRQSVNDIEILFIDDGSRDDTRGKVESHAAADARLRILDGPGRGPAAARNVGVRAARGRWIAILDGDDIMHPRRIELLLSAAAGGDSDILADNQILFYEDGSASHFLLEGADWRQPRQIDLALYIRANTMFGNGPALGYLKPLIRRALLGNGRCLYDESLRIGEDYDLIARLMLAKARFSYVPGAFYFYRRHQASISFRLGGGEIASLLAAADSFHRRLPADADALLAASRERRKGLVKAANFAHCVDRLKARAVFAAALDILLHPGILPLLAEAARGGLARRKRETAAIAGATAKPSHAKRFALLAKGDPAGLASTRAELEQAGWQGRVYLCTDLLLPLTAETVAPILLQLAAARDSDLVLYDDPALIDILPYLLSPAASAEPVGDQAERRKARV